MASSTPRLVYIMGRGHSGSTVLDALVGGAQDVEGVGELMSGWTRYDSSCSCGETVGQCTFWAEVRRRFEMRSGISWERAGGELKRQAIVTQYPHTALASGKSVFVRRLVKINMDAVTAIAETANKSVVIDSSKEVTRALFLARFVHGSTIIHLVRNPKEILASNYYRLQRGDGFKMLRKTFRNSRMAPALLCASALGWTAGEVLARQVKRSALPRTLLVRYEDLMSEPSNELARIGRLLNVNMAPVLEMLDSGDPLSLGHKIAGNRMRNAGMFSFEKGRSRADQLPRAYKAASNILTFPFRTTYGY